MLGTSLSSCAGAILKMFKLLAFLMHWVDVTLLYGFPREAIMKEPF